VLFPSPTRSAALPLGVKLRSQQRDADRRHPECANAGSTGASPRAALDAVPRGAFVVAHTVLESESSALVPHANNIVILSWIDLVASRHGDAAGASRAELAVRGRMWFVARHEIDYLGEAFAGDAPEVVGEEYAFLKRAAQKVAKKEDDSGTLL
jgi:hypothetical protein